MENLTIKEMTKERIKAHLVTIERMLIHYSGKKRLMYNDQCPLCFFDCLECLWEIIEGETCAEMLLKLYDDENLYVEEARSNFKFRKWRDLRREQLSRWERILKAELKRRAVKSA